MPRCSSKPPGVELRTQRQPQIFTSPRGGTHAGADQALRLAGPGASAAACPGAPTALWRPQMASAKLRRVTSTSGSSGMAAIISVQNGRSPRVPSPGLCDHAGACCMPEFVRRRRPIAPTLRAPVLVPCWRPACFTAWQAPTSAPAVRPKPRPKRPKATLQLLPSIQQLRTRRAAVLPVAGRRAGTQHRSGRRGLPGAARRGAPHQGRGAVQARRQHRPASARG